MERSTAWTAPPAQEQPVSRAFLVDHVPPPRAVTRHSSPATRADWRLLAADDEQIPLDVVLDGVVLRENHRARPLGRAHCRHASEALCAFPSAAGVIPPRKASGPPAAILEAVCSLFILARAGSASALPGSPSPAACADVPAVPDPSVLWLWNVVGDQPDPTDLSGPGDAALLAELAHPDGADPPAFAGLSRGLVTSPAHGGAPFSIRPGREQSSPIGCWRRPLPR